jgi:hypothetical protein
MNQPKNGLAQNAGASDGSGVIYRPKNGAAQNAEPPMGLKSGVWGLR